MKRLFLFPGQGSQSVEMGKYAFEHFDVARRTLEEADEALGDSLSKLISQGPEEVLRETSNAQPAILTVSVAIGRILFERGIRPEVMAGHSLGEYSALVMSNAISFADAVRLVRARGKYMQEAVPMGVGTMSAILGADDSEVEEVCREVSDKGMVVEPANYNCPGQLVISGSVEGVAAASEELKNRKVKRVVPLSVSAPFHSSLLRPAADNLDGEFDRIELFDPEIPYVANVDCEIVRRKEQIRERLVNQVAKPVRWTQSLQKILEEFSPDQMIEVGAGQVVSGHMKKIQRDLPRFHTDTQEALDSIS